MTLPNFLGIGVPRAGSTWLYQMLASHPDIFMNPYHKEIYFFNRYYDRGIEWYEKFFPPLSKGARYRAIGEFTPTYLFDERCIERISRLGTVKRFVVTLRDPVQRLVSNYYHRARLDGYARGIRAFYYDYPWVVEYSRYSEALARYIEHFGRKTILVLVFEEMVRNVADTKQLLAGHLGVEAGGFPDHGPREKVNQRFAPVRPGVARTIARTVRWLRDADADWALRAARAIRLDHAARHLMGARPSLIDVPQSEIEWLRDNLAVEVYRTEALLGRQIPEWHQATLRAA